MAKNIAGRPVSQPTNAEHETPEPPKNDADGHLQNEPAPGDVRQRAYDLYRARGGEDGHDLDDWFRAENELRQR